MSDLADKTRPRLLATVISLLALTLLLAACGDADPEEVEEPEEDLDEPAEEDEASVEEPDADAEDTEPEGPPSGSIGDTLTVGGVEVTVVDLIDPATEPAGWVIDGRFLAAEIELSNTSDETLSEPPRGTLIDDEDAQHGPGGGDDLEECQGLGLHDTTVGPGDQRTGCLSWDLDEDREVSTVQLEVRGEVGQWEVAP